MPKTTIQINRSSAALAVVVLLLLAACGGGTSASPTPAGATPVITQAPTAGAATSTPASVPTPGSTIADACPLLTPAEVGEAYGSPLDTATPSSDIYYAYCTYTGEGEVDTYVTTSAEVAASVFGTMKINDGEAVSGVGDEAYWSTDSFRPGLYFMKGGILGYISGSQAGPEDSIVQLGVLMASRM